MATPEARVTLADRMRRHAGGGTHLYAELMRAMADDWDAGGPVRTICAGWEDAGQGAVVELRLLAGLFRIVLTGRAPGVVRFYPCLGGADPPDTAWPEVRRVLADHVDELHDALSTPPQTNEVGRSTALLIGIFEAVRRSGRSRIRLLEPGASAGLNLLVDEFRFVEPDWQYGPAGSPLVLRNGVQGKVRPRQFRIVDRRGCDLAPVDANTSEGQLRLRSFVWPFHVERHERLTAAFAVAAEHPVRVDAAPASLWLRRQLALVAPPDVLTVVWHSITRQYWPPDEAHAVDEAIRAARERQTVARVAMEYAPGEAGSGAFLTLDGVPHLDQPLRLATVGDHGPPVRIRRGSA
jgi:hypothetical protein